MRCRTKTIIWFWVSFFLFVPVLRRFCFCFDWLIDKLTDTNLQAEGPRSRAGVVSTQARPELGETAVRPRAAWCSGRSLQGNVERYQGAVSQYKSLSASPVIIIVQELCESRGGRPGLSVLTSLLVSVDVKFYWTVLRHWSQLVPNMSTDIWGH